LGIPPRYCSFPVSTVNFERGIFEASAIALPRPAGIAQPALNHARPKSNPPFIQTSSYQGKQPFRLLFFMAN
jgi:hypothetical protein